MRDTGITRADILRFGIACALHTPDPDPDLAFVPLALIFEFPNQNQYARLDFVAQLYDKFVIIYHETPFGGRRGMPNCSNAAGHSIASSLIPTKWCPVTR